MSLHKTNFSPLDHGTRARRRDPLLVDIAKCIGLLPLLAWAFVAYLVRECWRDVQRLVTGRDV
jgi:hypothetical protein